MKKIILSILLVLIASTSFAGDMKVFAGKGLGKAIFNTFTSTDEFTNYLSSNGFVVGTDWRNKNVITAEKNNVVIVSYRKNGKPALLFDKASNTVALFSYETGARNKDFKGLPVLPSYEFKVWNGSWNGGIPSAPINAEKLQINEYDLL